MSIHELYLLFSMETTHVGKASFQLSYNACLALRGV